MQKQEIISKYSESMKKYNLFEIAKNALSLLIILMIIFLPIFTVKEEVNITDLITEIMYKYENPDECKKALENLKREYNLTESQVLKGGIIEVDSCFSTFDEFSVTLKGMTSLELETIASCIMPFVFPLYIIVMGVICFFICSKTLHNSLKGLKEPTEYCLNVYDEMLKRSGAEKKNFFKQQSVFAMAIYVILMLLFGKVENVLFSYLNDGESISLIARTSGLSAWTILLAVAFIGIAIVSYKYAKIKTKIQNQILDEQYS